MGGLGIALILVFAGCTYWFKQLRQEADNIHRRISDNSQLSQAERDRLAEIHKGETQAVLVGFPCLLLGMFFLALESSGGTF